MGLPATVGRYEIVRLLGEGALGRVLLARDPVVGRQVAVKVLRDDLPLGEATRRRLGERMRSEARSVAGLSHPNIVALHDLGDDPEVGAYVVFEYVDGQSLRERLLREPLPPAEVAKLARELGGALSHAHDAGLLHEAARPDNVLLAPTGAMLSDFGVGRLADEQLPENMTLPSPAYTAPEVLAGHELSPAADQFS